MDFGLAFQQALALGRLQFEDPLLTAWAESVARQRVFGSDRLTVYKDGQPLVVDQQLVRTEAYSDFRRRIESPSGTYPVVQSD